MALSLKDTATDRLARAGRELLERFFAVTGAEVVAVTPQQATLAIGAFRAFGKGRHIRDRRAR